MKELKELFVTCFLNQTRVEAMSQSYKKLQFFTFEVRTLGVVRVSIVVVCGFITALASIQSSSPIPLFLFLAIIIQSFVGSLFPRRGITLNLANPSFALPLLTLASVFHFGALFLWPFYRKEWGQHIVVWSSIVVIGVALVQFACSTLYIHLKRKTTFDRIRWTYAVFSLVLVVFDRIVILAANYSDEVRVFFAPFLQITEIIIIFDYVLVSGFVFLIFVEAIFEWSKVPGVWGPKYIYVPIEYPKDDVDDSFIKSVPRDARLSLVALVRWISVQLKNLWRLVRGVLTGFVKLLNEIKKSVIRYWKVGLSACLLIAYHLLPIFFVGLALFLAHVSASCIATTTDEFFALKFFLYMFLAAWVLLIAYLTHYYVFAREIARHFRQSFLAFVHFCILGGMLIGAVFWFLFKIEFAPGYAFCVALILYLLLAVGIYMNRSEIDSNKKSSGADSIAGTLKATGSSGPSYWLFFLMVVLAVSVASKQWHNDGTIERITKSIGPGFWMTTPKSGPKAEEVRQADLVRTMREAEERAKAEAARQEEQARMLKESRARQEAEERAKAEAAHQEEQTRVLKESRARQEAAERAKAEAARQEEQARMLKESRARQEAAERAKAEAARQEEQARVLKESRARQEAAERAKAEAARQEEQARILKESRARQEAEERAKAEAARQGEQARILKDAAERAKAEAARNVEEAKRLPSCQGKVSYMSGLWTNCFGDVALTNGVRLTGEFRNGLLNGPGILTWDGKHAIGQFKNGKLNGHGSLTWGGQVYSGEFKDGRFYGQGTLIFPDGQLYIGEFRSGQRNGRGIQYRANGTIEFSGFWENGASVRNR